MASGFTCIKNKINSADGFSILCCSRCSRSGGSSSKHLVVQDFSHSDGAFYMRVPPFNMQIKEQMVKTKENMVVQRRKEIKVVSSSQISSDFGHANLQTKELILLV